MAEAPEDPSTGGPLEQKVLQVLTKAGSPLPTQLLVKECRVPKKELNQVLYRMQRESKVSLSAPATWRLGRADPGGLVPAQPAQPSIALRPQQDTIASAESPGPQLSDLQDQIYRFLKTSGPCKALHIAKALGLRTAKDVNPDLYKMRNSHLLSCDENSKEWKVSGAEDSGRKTQSATIIYQQNPVNMICQSQISIANSEATQIGHGNVIVKHGENGAVTPHWLPPGAPGDPPIQGPLAGSWGPQDVHMERSMLQRVQIGNNNEMKLLGAPSAGPACSPPASATAAGTDASFEIPAPHSGPHPEAEQGQRIRLKSCYLEEASVGHGNKMTIILSAPGCGGAAGPGDREKDPGEEQEGAGSPPEAAGPRSSSPLEVGPALPTITVPTPELGGLTLRSSEAVEESL